MVRITLVDKLDIEPMPPFKTMEEEIAWWDTHSIFDTLPDGTPAMAGPRPKTKTLSVRLDDEDMTALRRQAQEQGIGPTTLARMWVRQQLRRRPHTR